jgi:hypothetical protein
MIHPIAVPITCRENPIDVSSPVGALAEFYRAFNARDLRLMQANLAGGDEPVMDNPLGGILRGWRNIQTTYERFFGHSNKRVGVEFFDYTIRDLGRAFVAIGRECGALEGTCPNLDLAIRTTRIFVWDGSRCRQLRSALA